VATSIDSLDSAVEHAVSIIERACQLAGKLSFVRDLRRDFRNGGLLEAIKRHDTPAIFDWLIGVLSYQGIANSVAAGFLQQHGNVSYRDIQAALAAKPSCPKLGGHWHFNGCGYRKSAQNCLEPLHFAACPLPEHFLRNGRLNQTAYSLFLFMHDVADGDFVSWINQQLAVAARDRPPDQLAAMRDALTEPMRSIHGISHKVIVMALSALLIGAGGRKPTWMSVGTSFVVVDTLVHNFLHRTGVLHRFTAEHPYGLGCYRPGSCADILQLAASHIDASRYSPDFPATFPRFVQHAVWRYCANEGLNICNGNQISDDARCDNHFCRLYNGCDRQVLKSRPETAFSNDML
jgi:hypothetical protein